MGPELLLKRVEKEVIVKDIQFRGAISDFSAAKKEIGKADYDNLLIRYNEDDIYGDGNNFEVAVLQSVADAWEAEVTEKLAAAEAAAAAAAEAAEAGTRSTCNKFSPLHYLFHLLLHHHHCLTRKNPPPRTHPIS